MKNIPSASLFALGFLSLVFSFALKLNVFDAQHIFSINAALAASTSTADISGTVYGGDTVDATNPGKGGISIELYDNGGLMPVQVVTATDGTFSAAAVSGVTSACIVIPSEYQLNSASDCYFFTPEATGTVGSIDFTIGLVPQGGQATTTLNVLGKITTDAWAMTPIPVGLVTLEIRDSTNALATSSVNDRSGLYSVPVIPATYTACYIVPGGYAIISGDRCQPVDFASNADVTLNDVMLSTIPVMTRNGESTLSIDFGASYVDAGATATKDGRDLTDLIKVSGLPDINTSGLYVVTYAVTDPNTALSATTTRLVTVAQRHESAPIVIGGYSSGSSAPAPIVLAQPIATTSTSTITATASTATGSLAVADESIRHREQKAKKDYLRKRAMGNVLGAEVEATGTQVTVSTSAMEKIPNTTPTAKDYLKPMLSLLAFGGAIAGVWWWKKKMNIPAK